MTSLGLSNEQNTLDTTDSGLERLPAAGFTLKSLCRPRSATAPIRLWQVGAPGRATTLLAEERSSSQGGYGVSMSLYFDKSQARQLTCQ